MVLANEVNPVNDLYRQLSSRYKAGWTFHRFLQGLRKFFGSQDLDDQTPDFQELYQGLKDVSVRLNDLDIPPVIEKLEELARALDVLVASLDKEDRKIAPSLVRLFFQRVKTQDERILIDLVRFYVEVQRGRSWEAERLDKVDFLLTRLGEAILDAERGSDPERLRRVLGGLSEYAGAPVDLDPQKVANRIRLIQAVRGELESVGSFEELTERDLVAHYRNLKHGLGPMVFERSILPMVVRTNRLVAKRVNELTVEAQDQIFQDYERVSALDEQGLLHRDLAESVTELHEKVGSFRKQMQVGTLRLEAMAEIQQSVRQVFGQIEMAETADLSEEIERSKVLTVESALPTVVERELLGTVFVELLSALRETRRAKQDASRLDPKLLEYRLVQREIEAFARLASGADCDVGVEQLLLVSASLRRKIRRLVDELHGVGVDAEAGLNAARASKNAAIKALRIGDLYLRRFGHFFEVGVEGQSAEEMRELQAAKVHLMREYSGLWLLVYSPRG